VAARGEEEGNRAAARPESDAAIAQEAPEAKGKEAEAEDAKGEEGTGQDEVEDDEVKIEELDASGEPKALPQEPDDPQMFGGTELLDICDVSDANDRRKRLRQALVGKFAYYKTVGHHGGRKWSSVVLGAEPVGESVPGGMLDPEEMADRPDGPRRHPLRVAGVKQSKWRSEVHNWRGYCIVVCRAPPEEAWDPEGQFESTQVRRFVEVDRYDNVLEHTEPPFIEVPIPELLPEKWKDDYVRACGGGEKGEQVRINPIIDKSPHVPKAAIV